MRAKAGAVIALCLGGCTAGVGDAGPAVDPDAERQATRAIWGIVPDPPGRKAELRSEMIKGAAVAVSADTLLADCAAVSGRKRVGLVRHNKLRLAEVAGRDGGQICHLTVAEGPLSPVSGYRSFADLRVGEPISALASRSAANVLVARGWLAGKGDLADPFLEVTAMLPATGSAVLFDGSGNLLGLGAVAELPDAMLLAVPVPPALTPALANRDLGLFGPLLAGAVADPRAQPTEFAFVMALGAERDSLEQVLATSRGTESQTAAAGDPAPPATGGAQTGAAGSPGSGPGPDRTSGGPTSPPGGALSEAPGPSAPSPGTVAAGPEPAGQAVDRGRDAHDRGWGPDRSNDDDRRGGRGNRGRGRR